MKKGLTALLVAGAIGLGALGGCAEKNDGLYEAIRQGWTNVEIEHEAWVVNRECQAGEYALFIKGTNPEGKKDTRATICCGYSQCEVKY
ncbi:hypothetical protein HOD05_04985 [Candidatus Woesearchaeota archaeon]|jgi:hypothetical protein|nr:hypothetical protein [Candidatus Woesearchaeota archaeon]MBT4150400.1 hypothetical protein [Candidatus Woesearchaeota archaeon]MBT4247400.1 hypothetical protein [Candidatus Woesearchaeota archaeon]MBT4434545.1 hypothetical protein [Candidatus Woesearchaeota archaeon]MBT7332016.1 hypothetical protein [Candidatus Woesearchaeota archaeon]